MKTTSLLTLPNHFWQNTEDATFAAIRSTVLAADSSAADSSAAGAGAAPAADSPEAFFGAFSLLKQDEGCTWLVRDRLGLNKLFYKLDAATRELVVGNYLHEVAERTGGTDGVFSVPGGHALRLDHATLERRLTCYHDLRRWSRPDPSFDLAAFHTATRARLEAAFEALAPALRGKRVFVCLSGGLDSTLVASLARRHLPGLTAVTFSFSEPLSADFASAQSIAAALGLPFFPVVTERTFCEKRLRSVLLHGQDWRDFNVHCAWVNDILGEALRAAHPDDDIAVLTGDLMNEYVADYAEVEFKGATYYPQLKIPRARRRYYFVFGLDSGDREVGIFARHGITTVQPYSVLAEHYLAVPPSVIDLPDSKGVLNLPLLPDAGLAELITKAKVRAQVGGSDGGVLGLFHDTGFGQERLKEEWLGLFGRADLIQAGRYASEA